MTAGFSHGATVKSEEEGGPRFGYLFNGGRRSTAGWRDNADYEALEEDLKLQADVAGDVRITLTAGHHESEGGLPGPRPPEDPALWSDSQRVLGSDESSSLYDRSEARRWHGAIEFRMGGLIVRGYRNDWKDRVHQEHIDWTGSRHFGDHDHWTVTHGGEAQYTWDVHEADTITVGCGLRADDFDSRSRDFDSGLGVLADSKWDADRTTGAVFAQNELRLWGARVYAGGRWDDPSDFGGQFTGRGGLVYEFTGGTVARLAAGQAFRAPSLNDLYWPSDEWSQGNRDLEPEKGVSFEAGVEHVEGEVLRAGVSLFRHQVRRMIVWAPTGPPGLYGPKWQPDNLNRAVVDGLEAEICFRPVEFLSFRLGYTLLDAEQENMELVDYVSNEMRRERRRLAYAPSHKVDVGAEVVDPFGVEGLRAGLVWRFQSAVRQYFPRYGAFPDTSVEMETKELPRFSVFDAKVSYKVGGLEAFLAAENLFDEEYAMQFGFNVYDRDYPMPGRSFTGGVSLEF